MQVAIAIGTLVSVMVVLLGSLLLAYLVLKGNISMNMIGVVSAVILSFSAAAGALVATGLSKDNRLLVTGITAMATYLILLGINVVFFDGQFAGIGLTALMIIAGAGVTLLPKLRKKPRKNRIKIPAYR